MVRRGFIDNAVFGAGVVLVLVFYRLIQVKIIWFLLLLPPRSLLPLIKLSIILLSVSITHVIFIVKHRSEHSKPSFTPWEIAPWKDS